MLITVCPPPAAAALFCDRTASEYETTELISLHSSASKAALRCVSELRLLAGAPPPPPSITACCELITGLIQLPLLIWQIKNLILAFKRLADACFLMCRTKRVCATAVLPANGGLTADQRPSAASMGV